MNSDLLFYLYHLATQFGGEVHADSNEVTLCFVNDSLPNPESPKIKEEESWATPESSISTMRATSSAPQSRPNRHRVLSDMDQFLKEQQQINQISDRERLQKKQTEFRSGELPYRNYPDGRPPKQ